MRKLLTLVLFSLISLSGLNFQISGQSTPKNESSNSLPPDPPIDIISLDRSEAFLPYQLGMRAKSGNCLDKTVVKVQIFSPKSNQKPEDFKYTVSGGKIIGNGEKIEWDLKGTRPGVYTITVQIEGITQTKEITDRECPECVCFYCECPSISISSPTAPANAGDTLIFTVNLSGGSQATATYNWTVSEGKIVEGQGTSQILVKTTPEMKGHTITATVDVGGLCENCLNTISASAEIKDK